MEADLVAAAAALRWARPDLTGGLADHVLEEASSAGLQDRWLAAAGWAVHARAATGDGRDTACGVLAALTRWGSDALARPAAHRLRIELAMVAAGAGEVEFARRLLAGVHAGDSDLELTADLLYAVARCAVEDTPDEVAGALDAADAAWAKVGGSAAELGGASVALIRAVVERRAGRPAAAVDHAADGLARLERGRLGSGTPSGHLAAALAAEWISALLDAGRAAEARDGCSALLPRMSEQARPTRQLALLRLTVARALAAQDGRADTSQLLGQAAEDAAGSDVPDLEAVCRTALGALHERAGRLDVALEELQLAVGAERRNRDRWRRFQAAMAELPTEPVRAERHRERAAAAITSGDSETTTLLPAITRGDRKLKTSRREEDERARRGSADRRHDDAVAGGRRGGTSAAERATSWLWFERMFEGNPPAGTEPAADDERSAASDTVPWNGSRGDSPIDDLLIRSLRADAAEHADSSAGRRNGKALGELELSDDDAVLESGNGRAPGTDSAEPPAGERGGLRRDGERSDASSGWMPKLDSDRADERRTQGRRRGRSADSDRRRTTGSRSVREDRDEATSARPRSRHLDPGAYSDDDLPLGTDSARGQEPGDRRSSHQRRRPRHGEAGGADDLDDVTTTERFAPAPDEPAPAPGATRPRRETTTERDLADEEGRRSRATRSDRGPRRPADDPWATGRRSVRPDQHGEGEPVPASSEAANEAVEPSARSSSSAGDGSGGWLQAALAELDRALSGIRLRDSARTGAEPPDDRCALVVDLARDGRRFAGPRAAAVLRSVADLLADRLPPGARSRFGDADALVITGPGWSRADATDWMHRTLPGLLGGFVATEELPGAQLRVAVHDAGGAVGAQILQPLTPPARERGSTGERRPGDGERGRDLSADRTDRAAEARGRTFRAARADRQVREGAGRARQEFESEPAEQAVGDGVSPRWPWSGADGRTDLEAPPDERDESGHEAPEPAGDPDGGRSREGEPDASRGSASEAGRPRRHGADRGRSRVASLAEDGDRGSPHLVSVQDRASGDRVREELTGSGRAGRRRDSEATGTETPGSSGAGRRARNDGRETGRSGADHPSSAPGVADRGGHDKPRSAAEEAAPDGPPQPSGREPDRPESTEGLGIADLLAGALAAYRGI